MPPLIRAIFLIAGLSLISPQLSHACSCAYMGKFIEYSEGHTIIRGEIKSYGPRLSHGEALHATMKVSIVEVITGSIPHTIIEFTGDPGHLCLTYVNSDRYPIGSEHLFTVHSQDKKQGLGGCGEVSVSIIDGKVKGFEFVDGERVAYSIDYDDFIKLVKE